MTNLSKVLVVIVASLSAGCLIFDDPDDVKLSDPDANNSNNSNNFNNFNNVNNVNNVNNGVGVQPEQVAGRWEVKNDEDDARIAILDIEANLTGTYTMQLQNEVMGEITARIDSQDGLLDVSWSADIDSVQTDWILSNCFIVIDEFVCNYSTTAPGDDATGASMTKIGPSF